MDQKILREYLLSLGFKVDEPSAKKMDKTLANLDKRIFAAGKALASMGVAANAAVLAFANSMEKAYFASKLGQSTVANMNAAAAGGRQIGLSADQIKGSVIAMSMALRSNPGLQAFLESFGVPVQGRDMSDVMNDMVRAFGRMDPYLGMQFAEMFGMDPQTFIMMRDGLDEYNKAQAERARLAKEAGVNEDEAAAAAHRYMTVVRDLTNRVELLGKKLMIDLLPHFERFANVAIELLNKWQQITGKSKEEIWNTPYPKDPRLENWIKDKWDRFKDKLLPEHKRKYKDGAAPEPDTPWVPLADRVKGWLGIGSSAPAPQAPANSNFSALEAKYGLPRGLLDRMWAKESGRGKHMLSPKGAQGHFGFMPGTAKEWGVDPMDLASSSEGAAKYMNFLLRRYGGDMDRSLAAYNWGLGNVDKYGLGAKLPAETRDYLKLADGLEINAPQTTIIVQGSDNPRQTAEEIAQRLEQRDRDYVRNLTSVLE